MSLKSPSPKSLKNRRIWILLVCAAPIVSLPIGAFFVAAAPLPKPKPPIVLPVLVPAAPAKPAAKSPAAPPAPKPQTPTVQPESGDEAEEEPAEDAEPAEEPEDGDEPNSADTGKDPTEIGGKAPRNPLNALPEESLDRLIETKINDELWSALTKPLPCTNASKVCVDQLTQRAIAASPVLKAISQRVEGVNEKIEEAKATDKKTVDIGVFKPVVQSYLKPVVEEKQADGSTRRIGPVQRFINIFRNPLSAIDEVFGLIGIPLFEKQTGTNAESARTKLAISDLQVKIAAIEAEKIKIIAVIRSDVVRTVLDFEEAKRGYQVSQEVARRSILQHKLRTLDYRFGGQTTDSYLQALNALDQRKAATYGQWSKLRRSLAEVKLIVLGFDADVGDE